ncbi:MAG: hypothetical protein ACREO5_09760 [Candidatus Binatia bacterium]
MSNITVPFPTASFLRLSTFLKKEGSTRDPVKAIEDAVEYWLANAEWKKSDLLPDTVIAPDARGYMWKSLFLPHGTIVRIKYNQFFQYAKVEGDALMHQGESVSPNQFAYRVCGGARDAWRDLWIRRPSDEDYQHADSLRSSRTSKAQ